MKSIAEAVKWLRGSAVDAAPVFDLAKSLDGCGQRIAAQARLGKAQTIAICGLPFIDRGVGMTQGITTHGYLIYIPAPMTIDDYIAQRKALRTTLCGGGLERQL